MAQMTFDLDRLGSPPLQADSRLNVAEQYRRDFGKDDQNATQCLKKNFS